MTSKIKVDNINKVSDDSNIIKKCGTTTTIGSGASNPIVVDGSAVTLGRCGGTVALASGATQTGFGRTGTVDWQTTIKTGNFTAVSGEGYFCNTTSGAFTLTLPSSPSVGDIVSFKDYARTFDTNALTVGRGGSNMDGVAGDSVFGTEGLSATLIYMDATKGWSLINDDATTQMGAAFITASGGNSTVTCGNFKIHVFTGPGTFCVSAVGNSAGSNTVDYLVVAGGGGAQDGGGGAGGMRISGGTASGCYAVSPLGSSPSPVAALPVSVQGYSIVVGGGGAGYPGNNPGSVSTFSTITSAGGGAGNAPAPLGAGGSGGGKGGANGAGGTGNTPSTTPPQGNDGGASAGGPQAKASGGGGAGAAGGTNNTGTPASGNGGAGSYTGIYNHPSVGEPGPVGSVRYFAGGGGGGGEAPTYAGSSGGVGGGGDGKANGPSSPVAHGSGQDGVDNTGGGGAGAWWGENGNGGSGIVIIRYKFQ
jgi:hypothetical protein